MNYELLYKGFFSPITTIDCGIKCAPYNEKAVPFCCDTRHAVPSAYDAEWDYLITNTDLWHLWEVADEKEYTRLLSKTPAGHVLIEFKGYLRYQNIRLLTCRAFLSFRILTRREFLGLFDLEYEELKGHQPFGSSFTYLYQNLSKLTIQYLYTSRRACSFQYHSAVISGYLMNARAIPLIDLHGHFYKITPQWEKTSILPKTLKFGPYQIAELLPFPDEI
jgi:hypothetical protein